jgi:hypothetical protein
MRRPILCVTLDFEATCVKPFGMGDWPWEKKPDWYIG